jgi:uncharacterized protein (DUF3820 family)
MIKNFSPREIALMLDAPEECKLLAFRIKNFPRCKEKFGELVQLIAEASVPTSYKTLYTSWLAPE